MAWHWMSGEEQGNSDARATKGTEDRHRGLPSRVWVPVPVHALSTALSPRGYEHMGLLRARAVPLMQLPGTQGPHLCIPAHVPLPHAPLSHAFTTTTQTCS